MQWKQTQIRMQTEPVTCQSEPHISLMAVSVSFWQLKGNSNF